MPNYDASVSLATIDRVDRAGADIVLSLQNAVGGIRLRSHGTVTFVGVTGIESVDARNDLVQHTLDPGWTVSDLSFQDGVARLGVFETEGHDRYPVLHAIRCSDVAVRMRPAVLATLGRVLSGL